MKHGINQALWSGRVLGKFGTFPLSQMLKKTTRMPVRGLCKSLFPTLLFPLSNIVNTFDSTFQLAAGFFPCQDKPRASCILTVLLPKPRKSSIYEFEKIITLIMNIYYSPPPFFIQKVVTTTTLPHPTRIFWVCFCQILFHWCSELWFASGYLKRNCYCTLQNVMSYLFEWLLSAKSLLQMAGCVNKGHIC